MLLHIVGGGNSQVTTARKIKERGYSLLVSDYTADAPAKAYADYTSLASTFDAEAITAVSRRFNVDGILTTGTDQPVLTCALAAERLNLPYPIDSRTATAVTDKGVMKPLMQSGGIPTNPFTTLPAAASSNSGHNLHRAMAAAGITFPAVLKPVDSQGQRGVVRVDSPKECDILLPYARQYSRKGEVLLESYYPSDEITVSGWVTENHLTILSVTDRVTEENPPHIGVCFAHRYPSRHIGRFSEIAHLAERITRVFNIENGPIYIQMLIGEQGIRINEIACRIGGAYEDEVIPLLTGFDIADMLIAQAAGENPCPDGLESFSPLSSSGCAAVLLFFVASGTVDRVGDFASIAALPGVHGGRYQVTPGTTVGKRENATQRAGYVVITADTLTALEQRVISVYDHLTVTDPEDRNMIIPLERTRLFP